MDSKLLLIKCITLLYREAELSKKTNSADLCRQVIETIRIPEASMEIHTGREVIVGLRETVLWMIERGPEVKPERGQFLQRIRVNTKDDEYLYNAVEKGIEPLEDEEEIQRQVLAYRSELRDYLAAQTIGDIIARGYQQINFANAGFDHRSFVRDIHAKLEPFTHDQIDAKNPAVVDSVDFGNAEEMEELLTRSKEEVSVDGTLKTGYQAINRMMGEHEGFRRGEFVVVGALQHNFKTGFTMNLFKHLGLYNKPYMRDKNKKPLIIHISLENELPMNILWLYGNLKENETQELCDTTTLNVQKAAEYIRESMGVNGYEVVMKRLEPGKTTYHDLFDILSGYETEGYEVHAVVCDYLNMIDKKGLNNTGPTGSEVRDLFRRVRNFCAPRGITFITPHQLSTEAKMLVRQGVDNFVQEVANKGYYDSCRTIDQEVDLEIYIHIEKIPGKGSYLTCQRGKHRKVGLTKNEHLYCVFPFHEIGGVLDDINSDDLSVVAPGGSSVGEGGGDWFDL